MILALSAGREAPGELRARLALDDSGQRKLLRKSRPGVGEMAVLCTCHRTEIYATAEGPTADALHAVAALLPDLKASDHHDLTFLEGLEAVGHLFRVACGLDSLVVGEPQVLGQVRKALTIAGEEKSAGPVLSNVFGRAIRLGRRVRSETTLGQVAKTIGLVATRYLDRRLGGLEGRAGLVVGAGEAAQDAALALSKSGAKLEVLSRTPASARRLATQIGGTAGTFEELDQSLARSEFAVFATSGGKLLGSWQFPPRESGRPLLVLDLSVPPAVELDGRDGIELHTLEDLPGPRGPEIAAAVIDAEAMLKKEITELERWVDTRESGPVIRSLHDWAEAIAREEVGRAAAGLDLTDEQREGLEMIAIRIARKILHEPTRTLRESDEETRHQIQRLFGLEI